MSHSVNLKHDILYTRLWSYIKVDTFNFSPLKTLRSCSRDQDVDQYGFTNYVLTGLFYIYIRSIPQSTLSVEVLELLNLLEENEIKEWHMPSIFRDWTTSLGSFLDRELGFISLALPRAIDYELVD